MQRWNGFAVMRMHLRWVVLTAVLRTIMTLLHELHEPTPLDMLNNRSRFLVALTVRVIPPALMDSKALVLLITMPAIPFPGSWSWCSTGPEQSIRQAAEHVPIHRSVDRGQYAQRCTPSCNLPRMVRQCRFSSAYQVWAGLVCTLASYHATVDFPNITATSDTRC